MHETTARGATNRNLQFIPTYSLTDIAFNTILPPCVVLFGVFGVFADCACASESDVFPLPELFFERALVFFLFSAVRAAAVNEPGFHD